MLDLGPTWRINRNIVECKGYRHPPDLRGGSKY